MHLIISNKVYADRKQINQRIGLLGSGQNFTLASKFDKPVKSFAVLSAPVTEIRKLLRGLA